MSLSQNIQSQRFWSIGRTKMLKFLQKERNSENISLKLLKNKTKEFLKAKVYIKTKKKYGVMLNKREWNQKKEKEVNMIDKRKNPSLNQANHNKHGIKRRKVLKWNSLKI